MRKRADMTKRSLERFDFKLPARLEVVGADDEKEREVLNLLTSNICSGGAYFHTDQPLKEGTPVKLDIILSIEELKKLSGKQALVKVSGKVIRTEAGGMAICFSDDYQIKSI